MSRYIDVENLDCMENDKLVRLSDVIETVENQCSDGNMWGNEDLTLIDARKTIDELSDIPAVDAVPVVRCIECKYASFSFHQGELYISCENTEGLFRDVPEDGYCYCGEKVTE